ncbi:putative MnhB subunit of Na+/H+ antiporter [Desulfuromonas soudanensis]|uniref:Putative MnhB subunit of Na+/H+ antiporter n=1 Tax=Desulfuromonas soudanensis TaxID=1603606 RepID=A0A0M3QEV5_9BACT|nr:Na(+)/H(+) antiporter subunit B [Desulfuromonas soudanensis]ALC14973.1 putative MnhB subunit of Na+/H+ antiporter [Desulfuromonas soudanensis]
MKRLQENARNRGLGESLIIQTSVRILVPFIQLFGLYIIVHGHYSPGGGFQGGVVLGASFILLALAFDLRTSTRYLSERANMFLGNAGVLVYVGTGFLCAVVGGLFLDYSALDRIVPLGAIEWRSFGIFMVEVGVGLAVMNIMVSLFWDLGSGGALDEGL